MKIGSVEEFKDALKLLQLEDLEIKAVQVETDFSSLGLPRQVLELDIEYARFVKVIREAFSLGELLTIPLNSKVLEFVYKAEHHPRIFSQVFKAFEDMLWRRQHAEIK